MTALDTSAAVGAQPSFGHLDTPDSLDHDQASRDRVRPLSGNEFTAVSTVAALVGVLGLLGFVNSFARVADAARPSFGRLAFTVPSGIDLGIAVFAALDIVLARLDMRLRWLRLIPWSLTGATIYLNVAGEPTAFGKVAHAVLPALWVVAVEVAAHVVRVRAGLAAGTRMDTIRASRWVLAPWPTLKLWRRMVLWEIRSYPAALDRERARVLALTDLQDTYGLLAWRWKAPRRTRALYRLGELTPTTLDHRSDLDQPPPLDPATTPDHPADSTADTGPDSMADTTPPVSARRTGRRPVNGTATRPAKRSGKSGRPADREADALAMLTAHPNMTGSELGRRLKVSDRTGRRLHARVTELLATSPTSTSPDPHTPANDQAHDQADAPTLEGALA